MQTGPSKRRRLSRTSASPLPSSVPSPSLAAQPEICPSPGPVTPCIRIAPDPLSEEQISEVTRSPVCEADEHSPSHGLDPHGAAMVIPRPQGHISHLSTHETHYLQYYMEHGSRMLANLESDNSPLRSMLIPRAMSSPLLMKAVCAVSALHLANRSQVFGAQTAAVEYYSGTLSGLRTALDRCSMVVLPDDAMLAVGLLCKYEIVRGSIKQWVIHLRAMQQLIVSRGGFAAMDREAAEFLRGLYV